MQEKKSESSFAQIKTKIKVVFLGEQSTGKTSILTRYIQDKFEEGSGATVGIDFMAKNVHVGNNILRLQLWDTAGQERFRSLIPSYLKDAYVAFIVFDLTNQRSFDTLNEWIDLCHSNNKEKMIKIFLGNKSDLRTDREVSSEAIRKKIEETSFPYFQVSAKTGENIKQAFSFAAKEYYNQNLNNSELNFSTINYEKSQIKPYVENGAEQKMHSNIPALIEKEKKKEFVLDGNPSPKKKKKGCC